MILYASLTGKAWHVRSKSEVIIANALKAAGVPYRYEFPLLMDKNADNPDFPYYDFCKLHPDYATRATTWGAPLDTLPH